MTRALGESRQVITGPKAQTVYTELSGMGTRVVRRLAVGWEGVGGPAGGAPARLVGTTPLRRPPARHPRDGEARLTPVGAGNPLHTCTQSVFNSLAPGPARAGCRARVGWSRPPLSRPPSPRRPGRRAVRRLAGVRTC